MSRKIFPAKTGSRKMRGKSVLNVFLIVLIFSCISLVPSLAEELKDAPQVLMQPQGYKDKMRIMISTSGPTKFSSFWLDNPPRLVIEFKTQNIISKIDNELEVNQGVIKKIYSAYFGEGERRALKALTFELTQKVPYELWQEENTILLDIQTPQEVPLSLEEKEVFAKGESKEATFKRLAAMDTALKQLDPSPSSTKLSKLNAGLSQNRRRSMLLILLLIGFFLVCGLGFLSWRLWYRFVFKRKEITDLEIRELRHTLEEKNKLIEQKEIIYKGIEEASRKNEEEYEQVKQELAEKEKLIKEQELAHKKAEEELSQKTKEFQQIKGSFDSLKEVLIKKGEVKELTTPEEKGKLWIPGKSPERRHFPRLDLSKDYNRTIILRIESEDKSKSIKSFANNISAEGLCFETRSDFREKEVINLRLFFFGDKVPMMRIQARIIWKKSEPPINRYSATFTHLEEKDKIELNRYIESKIVK